MPTNGLLDNVVWLVSKPFGACQRVDQRLRVDCAQPCFQRSIKEPVACFSKDQTGNLVNIRRVQVCSELDSRTLCHLASEILNGTTRDIWRYTIQKGIELEVRGKKSYD
jgi:hypothetical protein